MRVVLHLFVGVLTLTALSAQQAQQPVFRSRVDLVAVDVAVVDKDGKAVTVLAPGDFTVTTNGQQRKIVSADFVSLATTATATKPAPRSEVPRPTSNSAPTAGRSFLFVVDVEHIAAGGGRTAIESISRYLDKLAPEDRVGLVVLPFGAPRVDLTTNRSLVKAAATRIIGTSTRNRGASMTVGEAAAIEQFDRLALAGYLERTRNYGCDSGIEFMDPESSARVDKTAKSCIMAMQPVAVAVMERERRESVMLLDSLTALAVGMESIDGPKSIVFLSEGLISDVNLTSDVRRFAMAAERARVSLYALNLTTPISDVAGEYNMTQARVLDAQYQLDGLSTLVVAARGELFTVSGDAARHLARIDAENAGYYLIAFERDPAEKDGERRRVRVSVNWPGAVVRARNDFTINPRPIALRPASSRDPKTAIAEVLAWPLATTEMGVEIATYATPDLGAPEGVKTILAGSLASAGQAIATLGYEITDSTGTVVLSAFEPDASTAPAPAAQPGAALERPSVRTVPTAGDRQLFLAAASLPAGRYQVKLAAMATDGRRGSVEHAFTVASSRSGALRMSDVFIGQIAPSGFVPSPTQLPGSNTLPVSVELYGDTPEALSGATVTLELIGANADPIATVPLTLRESIDARRRLATATLAVGGLPTGDYSVAAVLHTAAGAELRQTRIFTKR